MDDYHRPDWLNLDAIKSIEQQIHATHFTSPQAPLQRLLDQALATFLDSANEAMRRLRQSGDDSGFYQAFLLLATKVLSNTQVIRLSIVYGWSGTGYVLFRTLYSDVATMWYLHFNPHLVDDWLNEEDGTYQKSKDFKKKFHESAIFQAFRNNKVNVNGSLFALFSKTTHGSAFGARVFTEQGKIVLAPRPSPDKSSVILTLAVVVLLEAIRCLLARIAEVEGEAVEEYLALFTTFIQLEKDVQLARQNIEALLD